MKPLILCHPVCLSSLTSSPLPDICQISWLDVPQNFLYLVLLIFHEMSSISFFTWRNVTYFEWYLKITSTLKTPLTPIIQNQSLPCVLVQTLCRYFQCNICHLSSLPYLSVCLSTYLSSIDHLPTYLCLSIHPFIHPSTSTFLVHDFFSPKNQDSVWNMTVTK